MIVIEIIFGFIFKFCLVGSMIGVWIVYCLLLDGIKILIIFAFKKVMSMKVFLLVMCVKVKESICVKEWFFMLWFVIIFIILV